MKVVIIGGVAAGMSAATRLRRLDENAEIVVLEAGQHVSYANCGLPYYAGGVIEERSALLLQTPESLYARFRLDVRVANRATDIDVGARTVTVTGPDGQYTESYDELILSPGARPIIPTAPGNERMLVLRDVTDVDRLAGSIDTAPTGGSAVVVGGGFVGVEVAENLVHRGLSVTLVERADQVLASLDPEMAIRVRDELAAHGVDVRTGALVGEVTPTSVILHDAAGAVIGEVPADLVVAAIGVRPDIELAQAVGAATGPRGGIVVDEDLRTSVPNIWAVGDAAVKRDALADDVEATTLIPLANLANRHGRHVADAIMGRRAGTRRSIGTAVVGAFGITAASTGRNEKRLIAEGRDYRAIHIHPASHAGYYPGAHPIALKLLIDPATDAILGAQAVGRDGVEKRIDVIATAIVGGLTASDLADLELAYAPAYGSAKDPVNMLGYVADNLRAGEAHIVQWHELETTLAAGAIVVDVRTAGEYANGMISMADGTPALNIPVDELRERMSEIPTDRPVVVHCQVGLRGHTAARLLTQAGYDVVNLDGGYLTWTDGTRAVSTPAMAQEVAV